MRHSWKQRVAAATVSVGLLSACEYVIVQHSYRGGQGAYLARHAKLYARHRNGGGVGITAFSSVIAAIGAVCLALVPYELTLRALNSKRLGGED